MPQAQTALLCPPRSAGYGPLLSILRRREIACQGPLHKIGQRSPFLLLPMDIAPPSLARGYSASFQVSLREFFIPLGERCSLHSLASRHVRKQSNFRGHFFLPPPGPFLFLAQDLPTGRRIESHFRVVLSSPFPPGETREGAERGPFSPFSSGFLKFKGGIGPPGVGW